VIFKNKVLRKIFLSNRKEIIGDWRRVHNEKYLYSSPNIMLVITSRTLRRTGHVARKETCIESFG
jgi:hypothetical protein